MAVLGDIHGMLEKSFTLYESHTSGRVQNWGYTSYTSRSSYHSSAVVSGPVGEFNNSSKSNTIQSPALNARRIQSISFDATAVQSNGNAVAGDKGHDYRVLLTHLDGTTTMLPVQRQMGSSTENLVWTGNWEDVDKVRVEMQNVGGQGSFRSAVSNVQVQGTRRFFRLNNNGTYYQGGDFQAAEFEYNGNQPVEEFCFRVKDEIFSTDEGCAFLLPIELEYFTVNKLAGKIIFTIKTADEWDADYMYIQGSHNLEHWVNITEPHDVRLISQNRPALYEIEEYYQQGE